MDATLRDFEQALSRGWLRTSSLIQSALTLGPLIFLGVVVALYLSGQRSESAGSDLLETLSLVHGAMLLAVLPMAFVVPSILLRGAHNLARTRHGAELTGEAYAAAWLRVLQGSYILRMAMIEGAALFGTVIVLLAVLSGRLDDEPLWWLNALSTFVLLAVSVATFPTRDRVLSICRQRALSH